MLELQRPGSAPMDTQRWFDGLLRLLSGTSAKQRETVAKMVAAVILAGTLTVTALARSAAIAFRQRPRTLHKSFDRMLSSESFDPMSVYRAVLLDVIGQRRRVPIAIDWLSLRNDTIRVLLAAVIDEDGRGWPVLALAIPTRQRKKRQREIELKMLEAIRRIVPSERAVIVLADRGFDGAGFRHDVRQQKFDYVIRVRGNLQAHYQGRKYTTRQLACGRRDGTIRRDGVQLTAKKDPIGAFVSCWDEKSKGPWLLISDLADNTDEIIRLYAMRFRIEESIRDIKNIRLGLGLEETRIVNVRRWSVLLAVTIVSYLVIRHCGTIARARGLARDFSTSGRRPNAHSTFSLGIFHANASPDILREALENLGVQEFARAA